MSQHSIRLFCSCTATTYDIRSESNVRSNIVHNRVFGVKVEVCVQMDFFKRGPPLLGLCYTFQASMPATVYLSPHGRLLRSSNTPPIEIEKRARDAYPVVVYSYVQYNG